MNKRGQIGGYGLMGIFILMILGIVGVVFFGMYTFGHNTITNKLVTLTDPPGQNITGAARDTFGQVDSQLGILRYMIIGMFFALAIALFIGAYYSNLHPLIFVVFIFIGIAAVITAASISNTYEKIQESPVVGAEVNKFGAMSGIYNNLPTIIAVVAIGIAVMFFLGSMRNREVSL